MRYLKDPGFWVAVIGVEIGVGIAALVLARLVITDRE